MQLLALFPGPAQLSVVRKRGEPGDEAQGYAAAVYSTSIEKLTVGKMAQDVGVV